MKTKFKCFLLLCFILSLSETTYSQFKIDSVRFSLSFIQDIQVQWGEGFGLHPGGGPQKLIYNHIFIVDSTWSSGSTMKLFERKKDTTSILSFYIDTVSATIHAFRYHSFGFADPLSTVDIFSDTIFLNNIPISLSGNEMFINFNGITNQSSFYYLSHIQHNDYTGLAYINRDDTFHLDALDKAHSILVFNPVLSNSSVKLVSNPGDLFMYPNPATSTVNIVNVPINNFHSLELIDVGGRTLIRRNLEDQQKLQLDVSTLPPGYYNVFVAGKTRKLIVSRF